jgi:hypothetical protein
MQAAQNVSQVFLGINLKCASCHDSFINQWKLTDSYALAQVFSAKPLEIHRCDQPTGAFAPARFLTPQFGSIDEKASLGERRLRLAAIVTGKENARLSRTIVNRLWARFFGRGLVEPVDEMDNPSWNADLLDWLAADLVQHKYDLQHTIELMLASRAYQLPAVGAPEREDGEFRFRGPFVRRMSAEQFVDGVMILTGAWHKAPTFKPPKLISPNAPVFEGATKIGVRSSLVPADALSTALGRPNREQVVTSRTTAATTLEALELTNGATVAKMLADGAKKRVSESGGDASTIIRQIYVAALGRNPTDQEQKTAQQIIGEKPTTESVADLLWLVVMLPEFQLVH